MPSERDNLNSKVTCDICNNSFHSRGFNQHHRACKVKQEEKIELRTYQAKLAATANLNLKLSRNAPRIEGEARADYGPFPSDNDSDLEPLASAQNEASYTIAPCDKNSRSSRTE